MRKMIINNKEIITNYDEKSAERLVNGDCIKGYDLLIKENRESIKEFLERLVSMGYTRIRFGEIATGIRGIHDIIAYCKEIEEEKSCKDCENAEISAGFYYCNAMNEYTTFAKQMISQKSAL